MSAVILDVKIQRWAVIGRATDKDGRLKRDAASYRRTTAPQEERLEQVIRFVNRGRVTISFGGIPIVASYDYLLKSGRCIGNPDWVIVDEALKPLRKLARAAFPRKKKVRPPKQPVAPDASVSDS